MDDGTGADYEPTLDFREGIGEAISGFADALSSFNAPVRFPRASVWLGHLAMRTSIVALWLGIPRVGGWVLVLTYLQMRKVRVEWQRMSMEHKVIAGIGLGVTAFLSSILKPKGAK